MKYSFAAIALINSASAVTLSRHHYRQVPGVTFIAMQDDYMPERLGEYGKDIPEQVFAPEPETFQKTPYNDGTTTEGSTQVSTPQEKENEHKCDKDLLDGDGNMMDRHPDIKNPAKDHTWDCKNNYDVYTTDYDPEHNHFDRIAHDIQDVNKVMNHMKKIESEGGNTAVLNSMKTEMGIPLNEKVGEQGIDVPTAVVDALGEDNRGVNGVGFTKADGLEGSDKQYAHVYHNTGYNNN
jgi:hypothetical protein